MLFWNSLSSLYYMIGFCQYPIIVCSLIILPPCCWLSSKIDPLLRLILTHLNSEITWFSSRSFLYVNLIFYTVNWPVKRISWTEVQHPDSLPDHSIQYLWLCCLKQYHNPREAPLILVLLLKDKPTIFFSALNTTE